jgi:hypothetical protein
MSLGAPLLAALDRMSCGGVVLDEKGTVLNLNTTAEKLLKSSAHQSGPSGDFCPEVARRSLKSLEVVLNFGVSHNWDRGQGSGTDVELTHRIILSPFAAKRVAQLLTNLMKEYETRYGELK